MLKLITPPPMEPVSVAGARAQAAIEHSADEALLAGMIAAARREAFVAGLSVAEMPGRFIAGLLDPYRLPRAG